MTDVRLPEKLLNDRRVLRLLAMDGGRQAWCSHTMALMWAGSNRTEGVIEPEDLSFIPNFVVGDETRLVAVGLWEERDRVFYLGGWELDQTSKAQLEAIERVRVQARERKRRQRAREAEERPVTPVTGDVTRDNRGQDRTGQARTGQTSFTTTDSDTGEVRDRRDHPTPPASESMSDRVARLVETIGLTPAEVWMRGSVTSAVQTRLTMGQDETTVISEVSKIVEDKRDKHQVAS